MNKFKTLLFCLGLVCFYSYAQNYSVANIPNQLKENANAVVRLNNVKVEVEDRDKLTIYTTRVVTIFNESGERFISAAENYDASTKIKNMQVLILNEDGGEIDKIKEKDFVDRSVADGFSLFNDNRVKYLNYTASRYPYTVVFTSEVKTSNTAFIPSWRPVYSYYVSVQKDIYEVKAPVNLGLRVKEKNFDAITITKRKLGNGYQYSVSDIPAIKPESYSPPLETIYPKAMFALSKFHLEGVDGEVTDWQSFGAWMRNKLLLETYDLPETTKQKMQNLVADKPTTYEKAKAIYEYVQQNTRYVSIQAGIGGWKPMKASEVDNLGYGDCKALTNYTKNLLDAVGIEAYYTIVSADSYTKENLDTDFASIQGNHIILEIPTEDKDIWVDCTSQTNPFNFIGDFTDDRNVLVVKPEGGEIVKTVAYLNDDNFQLTTANCTLDVDGNLNAQVAIKTKGTQYDSRYHWESRSEDDQLKHYKKYWGNINNLTINSIALKNDKDKIEFAEEVTLAANNYISFSGETGLFVANMFNNTMSTPDRYRDRQTPLYISRGFTDKDVYRIKLPENFAISTLPESVTLTEEFGTYSFKVELNGSTLTYSRELSWIAGTYPKEKYDDFRKFMRSVSKNDNAKIVINNHQ